MKPKILSASILSADFTQLGNEINDVLSAGIDYIHFDVMDFHFVPNLSFGPVICKSLRHAGFKMPIDVHLMVDNPDLYIEPFARAGANIISFHPETSKNPSATIDKIHDFGMKAGLAFNPDITIDLTKTILEKIQMILLMSVQPGFSGQEFMPQALEKLKSARSLIDRSGRDIYLAIDGGIKIENASLVTQAGADFIIIGSGLFHSNHYRRFVEQFRHEII